MFGEFFQWAIAVPISLYLGEANTITNVSSTDNDIIV